MVPPDEPPGAPSEVLLLLGALCGLLVGILALGVVLSLVVAGDTPVDQPPPVVSTVATR